MNLRSLRTITAAFSILILLLTSGIVAEDDYSSYKSLSRYKNYFEISYDKVDISITSFSTDSSKVTYVHPLKAISFRDSSVVISEIISLNPEGLLIKGELYPYNLIYDALITDKEDLTTITFRSRINGSDKPARTRVGNRISFDQDIIVEEGQFIRGLVFSVMGSIEMYGEANKDLISLFGEIYIGPGAVARGDVASIKGRVDIASDASVYGEIYSGSDRRVKKKHTFGEKDKSLSLDGCFYYNRVDGATPDLKVKFKDIDSLLPSVWVSGGYAFNSERSRYEFGLEQILWRKLPLAVGGSYFRRLSSDDDWLLDNEENTVFALFATEDFKDYYESEGGAAYLSFKPIDKITFKTTYSNEETKWFEAQPHLWSMFGGNKLFRDNFSSVDSLPDSNDSLTSKDSLAYEINTTTNATIQTTIDYNTLDPEDPLSNSAWHITGSIEWSNPDLGSDFDYKKYKLSVRRYQKIHKNVMLMARVIFGDSKGYLPMYKKFYLGGIGTLRGYKYKELSGNKFWMMNLEYRVNFPKTDFGASIIWDAGQVSDEKMFDSKTEVKNSLGLALHIGKDFRISLSKRLDRSFDDDPRIHVRFDHVF